VADLCQLDSPEQALAAYLKDYTRHRDELLEDTFFAESTTYEKTVRTVWDTSFDMIRKNNPNSTAMLALMSFLHRDNVQEEIFRLASIRLSNRSNSSLAIRSDLPAWLTDLMSVTEEGDWDSFQFRRAMRPLVSYSMIHPTKSRQ
jgi:hypothetical protein